METGSPTAGNSINSCSQEALRGCQRLRGIVESRSPAEEPCSGGVCLPLQSCRAVEKKESSVHSSVEVSSRRLWSRSSRASYFVEDPFGGCGSLQERRIPRSSPRRFVRDGCSQEALFTEVSVREAVFQASRVESLFQALSSVFVPAVSSREPIAVRRVLFQREKLLRLREVGVPLAVNLLQGRSRDSVLSVKEERRAQFNLSLAWFNSTLFCSSLVWFMNLL